MRFAILLVLSASLISRTSVAQEVTLEQPDDDNQSQKENKPRRHFLGIHFATLVYWGLDEQFSPLPYRGFNLGGALHYEYRGEKNHHFLMAKGGKGSPKTSRDATYLFLNEDREIEGFNPEEFQVQGILNYAYHRAVVALPKNNIKFYIGGLLDFYVNYLESFEINWLGAYSLNLSTQMTAEPAKRHFVSLRVYVPFLTYLARPPWSIYNDKVMDQAEWKNAVTGRLTSVHEYIRTSAELRYEFAVSETWRLSYIYEISYSHAEHPTPSDSICNNFMLGITPGFGGRR